MNLQYSVTIYLAVMSLIILLMVVKNNDLLDRDKKIEFAVVIFIIIIAALSEWLGITLNGRSNAFRFLHIAARILDHSLIPLITFFFVEIVAEDEAEGVSVGPIAVADDEDNIEDIQRISYRRLKAFLKKRKFTRMEKNMMILLGGHALLEFLSAFTGFIFYVDELNQYHHGGWYWIYVFFYVGCSVYFLLETWKFAKRYQTRNRHILVMMMVVFVTGMGFGLVSSSLRCAYISLAIDTLFFYMYYTGIIEKMDGLTSLLNRRSYESRIGNVHRVMMVLYFDVDNFKFINDDYGHQFGDKCLKCTAEALRAVYGTLGVGGYCYRIGGDEFCVLIECDERLTDEIMESLNHRFFRQMEKMREREPLLPQISVGYGVYEPGKNDIESAITEADERMYEWKAKRKAERGDTRKRIPSG